MEETFSYGQKGEGGGGGVGGGKKRQDKNKIKLITAFK